MTLFKLLQPEYDDEYDQLLLMEPFFSLGLFLSFWISFYFFSGVCTQHSHLSIGSTKRAIRIKKKRNKNRDLKKIYGNIKPAVLTEESNTKFQFQKHHNLCFLTKFVFFWHTGLLHSLLTQQKMHTHLYGGAAVKAERLGLSIFQVDLQHVRHEQKGVVLHWILGGKKGFIGKSFMWASHEQCRRGTDRDLAVYDDLFSKAHFDWVGLQHGLFGCADER